jgi:hypothetical protein
VDAAAEEDIPPTDMGVTAAEMGMAWAAEETESGGSGRGGREGSGQEEDAEAEAEAEAVTGPQSRMQAEDDAGTGAGAGADMRMSCTGRLSAAMSECLSRLNNTGRDLGAPRPMLMPMPTEGVPAAAAAA